MEDFISTCRHKTLVIQRRYIKGSPSEVVVGELQDNLHVVENGMKLKKKKTLRVLTNFVIRF
ncbi:class I SAM-dependent methyltransferase [Candidatus Sulfurimonas marisnigri]|uniref:Class I SAM-dependent methyltransferase n=1 Tax=Candidatus Sulfurimonas marisnigri TaxID=2740405 RepID=A0A7S7LYD4_9BACT|nr:class I SAM-dependent methyltransferase [Candidatus Sulfurimonas marisnigri]QOY53725.1 class I SAM-dependent methyltransferase [Candidatus Sulfurimonas marisnigri]